MNLRGFLQRTRSRRQFLRVGRRTRMHNSSTITIMVGFSINQLPRELITLILQDAMSTSINPPVISCLICCKLWYSIGLPIVYRDVVLEDWNLHRLIPRFKTAIWHQFQVSNTRSLGMQRLFEGHGGTGKSLVRPMQGLSTFKRSPFALTGIVCFTRFTSLVYSAVPYKPFDISRKPYSHTSPYHSSSPIHTSLTANTAI